MAVRTILFYEPRIKIVKKILKNRLLLSNPGCSIYSIYLLNYSLAHSYMPFDNSNSKSTVMEVLSTMARLVVKKNTVMSLLFCPLLNLGVDLFMVVVNFSKISTYHPYVWLSSMASKTSSFRRMCRIPMRFVCSKWLRIHNKGEWMMVSA